MLILSLALTPQPVSPGAVNTKPAPLSRRAGFIFLDGRYLRAPYDIRLVEQGLTINGHHLGVASVSLPSYFGTPRSDHEKQQILRAFLANHRYHDVIVLDQNGAMLYLQETYGGEQLIRLLTISPLERPTDKALPKKFEEGELLTWNSLLSEFQPTEEFLSHADEFCGRLSQVRRGNQICSVRRIWLARIAFPITVLAMVVVAISFGHLMNCKPIVSANEGQSSGDDVARPVVARSLLLIAILSMIDLVFTLSAANSGSMRELNPLGSQLIDQPAQLSVFKLIASATAIALLYRFYRSPIAQAASWWCCLVLTLTTARWLTFGTMFL